MWCVYVPSGAAGYTILRRVIPYGGLCQVAHSPASTNPHRRGIPHSTESRCAVALMPAEEDPVSLGLSI
eukprot:scaffold39551_cov57-Phaeocystis_antarctica.AAC.8